jgi:hypothetical protein
MRACVLDRFGHCYCSPTSILVSWCLGVLFIHSKSAKFPPWSTSERRASFVSDYSTSGSIHMVRQVPPIASRYTEYFRYRWLDEAIEGSPMVAPIHFRDENGVVRAGIKVRSTEYNTTTAAHGPHGKYKATYIYIS